MISKRMKSENYKLLFLYPKDLERNFKTLKLCSFFYLARCAFATRRIHSEEIDVLTFSSDIIYIKRQTFRAYIAHNADKIALKQVVPAFKWLPTNREVGNRVTSGTRCMSTPTTTPLIRFCPDRFRIASNCAPFAGVRRQSCVLTLSLALPLR